MSDAAELDRPALSPVESARAALAEAEARDAALRAELAREQTEAVAELDRARQHKVSLMQRRAKGDPLDPGELDEARSALSAAETRAEALVVENADVLAAAGGEVSHWRGVLLSLLRDELRQRVAAVHTAANAAERRVTEAQTLYSALSNAEVDCGRTLRGGLGFASATPADIEAAIARCDAALGAVPAELRQAAR